MKTLNELIEQATNLRNEMKQVLNHGNLKPENHDVMSKAFNETNYVKIQLNVIRIREENESN